MSNTAFGTIIRFKSGPVLIGEMTNISPPKLKADTIDTTSHDSPDGFREFIAGLKDGGEVSIDGSFAKGNPGQLQLLSAFHAGSLDEYEIVFPEGSVWGFKAIVTGVETTAPHDNKIGFAASMKVSGKPVLTTVDSAGLTNPFFALSVGDATVAPAKAQNVTFYTANVVTGTASLTVTPTAVVGTIRVNGNVVATGQASSAIPLVLGPNTISVEVAEAGKTPKVYSIIVTRALL